MMKCTGLEDLCKGPPAIPSPKPAPEPEPEPLPQPEPEPVGPAPAPAGWPAPAPIPGPVSDCAKFCCKNDLREQNKWCYVHNKDKKACLESVLKKGDKVMPCKWTGTKCKSDKDGEVSCPDLGTICDKAASADEAEDGNDDAYLRNLDNPTW